MKVKCVNNEALKTKYPLTIGKLYEVLVVRELGRFYFLVFNDDGRWDSYPLDWFEPRDQE